MERPTTDVRIDTWHPDATRVPPRPPLPTKAAHIAARDSAQDAPPPPPAPTGTPWWGSAQHPSLTETARLRADLASLGLDELGEVEAPPQKPPAPLWRRISTWVAVYGIALALIAFWPEPVDSGAGRLLKWVTQVFPVLTYQRIEFGANVLLFVPLGIGLALLMKNLRYLVMPLGFLTSLTIEAGQAVFIPDRYPTVSDLIANTAGACIGLVAVVVFEAWRSRHPRPSRY